MKKCKLIPFLALIFACHLNIAQHLSLKEQSIEQFKKENYPLAISLMEKALVHNPKDAEIYYYLGFFNHYNAYDSRPLQGYDSVYSQKILNYLDKALDLNPNYGDAKYFYFTECSAAAFKEYQNNNILKFKNYFEKAHKKGAIPEWSIELGKNMLNLCDSNSILFTHGDFSLNICIFAQLNFNFRKDISIIPLALLGRPGLTLALNTNANSKILRGVKIGMTKDQIMDIHPFKWDTLTFKLPVPSDLIKIYSLPENHTMDWVVEPDLVSNRITKKIESDKLRVRTFLSPCRAVFFDIIKTNNWNRPVYFSNTFESYFLAGLEMNFQNCGLISKLLPFKTEKTNWEINVTALENLVFDTKLEKLKTIIDNDQPRVSNIVGLYSGAYYMLAEYYNSVGRKDEILKIIVRYKKNLMIGFKPDNENRILNLLEEMGK